MKGENLFPLNNLTQNIEMRGSVPMLMEFHQEVMGAMSAGVKTTDFDSAFGLGLGEVLGIQLLNTTDSTNRTLGASVAASATAGKVSVTINSTNASSVVNHTLKFWLYGRIIPKEVA